MIIIKTYENFKSLSNQWNTFRDKGTKLCSDLVNKHLKLSYTDLYDYNDSIKDNIELQIKFKETQFNDLQQTYIKLSSTLLELKAICEKMEESLNSIRIPKNPTTYESKLELKLFEYLKDIITMYINSLENKNQIVDNLLVSEDREQLLLMITCWSNDIHIDYKKISIINEIFLNETTIISSPSKPNK
ncbi:hypothetical protein DICPUDRAFT_84348 [Dictyostelium purpureum]|uniref:Uncharacterized protein n=1 Tax=Dictyostelium purpureum TaxID=5786 RepID=F1A2D8_DICPU|nr:uncharacterized protein DICPUDRAFT_84348 [Dictyostelium purpureum]EGC29646.1 hypothetical protein DICPUDRAFT_84348 [Dictyostelium purpureum]|eukprot:XP_003293833.1 hypothetical protein DICPUDRAFT_84348 [Dictyostelium purpureum]